MRMPRSQVLILASLLVTLPAVISPAYAQDPLYDGNQNLPPFGSFSGGQFGTVALQNGNLHISIPIINVPGRGSTLPVSFNFVYDTPLYRDQWVSQPKPGNPYNGTYYVRDPIFLQNGTGWRLVNRWSGWTAKSTLSPTLVCTQLGTNYQTWIISGVTDPEGASHPLALRKETSPCHGQTLSGPTLDGSGIWAATDSAWDGNLSLIILKDGTQVGTTIKDSNGNEVSSALDTVGRNMPTIVNGSGYQLLTYQDSNGNSQSFRIDLTTVSVSTQFCQGSPCFENTRSQQVPTKLTLPNGTFYTFNWVSNSAAELQSVVLPTGGSISYTYTTYCSDVPGSGSNNPAGNDDFMCRRAVQARNISSNGTTATWNYSYVQGGTTATVTDPYGNDEVHTFQSVSSSLGTYETDIKKYSGSSTSGGTLLRTVHTDYAGETYGTAPLGHNLVANVRPIRKTTTLENNLVSKTETDYETFSVSCPGGGAGGTPCPSVATRLNPTEYREFDYGSGAPGPLLRKTDYTYLHTGNQNYISRNIVDLVLVKTTLNGAGTQLAQATYEYDNYNHANQPMLTSNAVQHDSTYSTSFIYRGNITAVQRWVNTNGSLLTTTNQFDDAGNLISTLDPRGNKTSFDYTDSWANTACAPTGQGKAYPTTVTNALGQLSESTYNSCMGSLASSKDQNDINASRAGTTFSYDSLGRVTSVNYPDSGQTTNCYTDVGGAACAQSGPPFQVVTTHLASPSPNQTVTTFYDGLGRPTEKLTSDTDCSTGDRTDTTYDALDRVHTVSNPYCATSDSTYGLTTYAYDALNRPTQVTHPDNSTILTMYTGRATQVQDEGNGTQRVTRISQVDGLGRLTSVCEVSSASLIGSGGTPAACGQDIAGTGFLTTYQYDALDNLNQVNQSGIAARTFSYDSLSRLTNTFNAESGTTSYTYDADGNVHTKIDARTVTTTYAYDALNRLTGKTYSDSTPAATFNYDQTSALGVTLTNTIGRKSSESTGGSLATGSVFSYDKMGRFGDNSQCTPQNCGTGVFSIQYTQYDLSGNLISGTNAVGVTFTYAYNSAARLTSISSNFVDSSHPGTLFSQPTYNAPGFLKTVLLGNGLTETRNYNSRLFLTSLTAGTIYSLNMASYAPNGDVLAANDRVNGNWTYTYDPFNRFVGSNQNNGAAVYGYVYDRFGNRWQQNGPNSMQLTFTGNNPSNPQNNNRMDGYSYDAAGNLLNDGSHNYFYDAENRLIQVDGTLGSCSTATACYVYDAEGRRVRKATPSGTLDFLYDAEGHKVAEVDPTGTFLRGELFAAGRHFAVFAPDPGPTGATFFTHADWLGTERARTNMGGTACETITSLPFGDGQTISDSCGDSAGDVSPLHFTGKERDSESGNDNFGARYYSSSLGRFMSTDPLSRAGLPLDIRDPQSWNAYAYVRNNPLNLTDPDGTNYTVCQYDQNGNKTNCADLTNKQYEQFLKDNPNIYAYGGNLYTYNPATGTTTKTGTERYYNEKDVQAAQFLSGTVQNVISAAGIAELAILGPYAGPALVGTTADVGLTGLGFGSGGLVLGKMGDLNAPGTINPGEYTLPSKGMPNQGSPQGNWEQNSGMLRFEMSKGKPIRDASVGNPNGETGFLRAERNLLRDHGWTLNGDHWYPPNK